MVEPHKMNIDNIICLPGELGRYAVIRSNPVGNGDAYEYI